MKKIWCGLFIGVSLIWAGCKVNTDDSGDLGGTDSTTFKKPSALQLAAPSGYPAATKLLTGNFNGDDYQDLVMLTESGVLVYLAQNGSSWQSAQLISETASARYSEGIAEDLDFDSSANLDLILFKQPTQAQIFLNNGDGTFTSRVVFPRSALLNSLAYAPAKGTNKKQGLIYFATNLTNHSAVQQSDFVFGSDISLDNADISSPLKALSGDINGDGYNDIVVVPSSGAEKIQIYQNTNDATFSLATTLTRNYTQAPLDAALVDMNKDGKKDLLISSSRGIELYLGDGSFTGFTLSSALNPSTVSVAATSFTVGDFTGDGKEDLFMARSSTSLLYTQSNSLAFSNITDTAFSTGNLASGTNKVYSADIDGNGVLDLLELKTDGSVAVHINNFNN